MACLTASKTGDDPSGVENPEDKRERVRLERLIKKHRGNLSAIAKAERITRQGLTLRLERFGLVDAATLARAGAGIGGPRQGLVGGVVDPVGERQRILDAAAQAECYDDAVRALGMSRRQFYRKLRAFQITPAAIMEHRKRRRRRAQRGAA